MSQPHLSDLSPRRRTFVRECQRIGFGKISGLLVRAAEPVFSEATEVLMDIKLDSDETPRPEQSLTDFALASDVLRFFSTLDTISDGTLANVEVRAGIPRRIQFHVPTPINS